MKLNLNHNYIIENYKIKEGSSILTEEYHDFDYMYIDIAKILNKEELEEIYKFQSGLNKEYIYQDESGDKGLELSPHCTLVYGIIPTKYTFRLVKQYIERSGTDITLKFKGIGFFRKDKPYDVMYIELDSPGLSRLYYDLKDKDIVNIDHNSMAVDNGYHAHETLAYITKGAFNDNQYQDYKFSFSDKEFIVKEIEYQYMNGDTTTIYI